MTEAFSINREFDFVRLEGLRRATGRPAHEWDIYIIKELIDNALDADDTLWQQDPSIFPDVKIWIEYIHIPERQARQLFVQVQNRALFPVDQLDDVFATQKYTSSKSFTKGLTRGALGNALKTLLGIPYALHNRATGDWQPELKPMSIICQEIEYQPRYHVDRTAQEIRFECKKTASRMQVGTIISVGLDVFDQERPRTLDDFKQLALQYHLVNPHVCFQWAIEIEHQEWQQDYEPNLLWKSKYQEPALIQWYFGSAFQDLLAVLYRKFYGEDESQLLPIKAVTQYFAGLNDQANEIETSFKKVGISKTDIEGAIGIKLYKLLAKYSPKFDVVNLGYVGQEHLCQVLKESLPLEGDVLYGIEMSDSDPNIPFVIEAAVAYLAEEVGRIVWTAVNFTPTYGDPFMRAWLTVPIQPNDPALGLRGLLDAYGLTEDTSVAFCLHLICPNVEHSEFSKTDVNHLPFKGVLGNLFDRLFAQLKQRRDEAELRLQEQIFKAIDSVLAQVGVHERFIFGQLLEKLKSALSDEPGLADWLARPDVDLRLRAYITSYQSQNTVLSQRVARPASGTITLPSHPDRYFSLLVEHVSRDLLSRHHVNKILYIQGQEWEPVVIENNWLCQMDMALLHNISDPNGLRSPLVQLASRCELPILVLHDATQSGQEIVTKMRTWLVGAGIELDRLIDLGLTDTHVHESSPKKLVEMMPSELADWLIIRLKAIQISIKWLPSVTQIRRDISQRMQQYFHNSIWEGMGQHIAFSKLLIKLDEEVGLTVTMIDQMLDDKIQQRLEQVTCTDSYRTILDEVIEQFYTEFMQQHGDRLKTLVKAHALRIKNEWK